MRRRASRCTRCSRTSSSGTSSPGTGSGLPAGGPYNTDAINDDVSAFPWDGTRLQSNGNKPKTKVVPDGSYKIVVKALKAGGDPKNPAHWETWTTPTIKIDRP